MPERYRIIHAYQKHYVVNRMTGNVVTKPIMFLKVAKEIKAALETGTTSKLKQLGWTLDDDGFNRELANKPVKGYVVCGSSFQTWQAEMEDGDNPSWEDWSSPQVIAVGSTGQKSLRLGIDAIMEELLNMEFSEDPDTGEEWMPGMNPLDTFKWVDQWDKPVNEACPVAIKLWGEEFGWPDEDSPYYGNAFKPHGRPAYSAYLREDGDAKTERYHAVVIVQEVTIDE